MITFYELCGEDGLQFSPYCWRTKMCLLHKKMAFSTTDLSFIDIQTQFKEQFSTLPAIKDGETVLSDSFKIADYLEANYPESPSLFGCEKGRLMAFFSMSGLHRYIRRSPKLPSLTFTASLKIEIKLTFVPLERNTFKTPWKMYKVTIKNWQR